MSEFIIVLAFLFFAFQSVPPHLTDLSPSPSPPPAPQCLQVLTEVPPGHSEESDLHRPVAHESAFLHATGEAKYIDDMPQAKGTTLKESS